MAERSSATWTIPCTPATNPLTRKDYVVGLAAMYVADPRFASNYGGADGATFVQRALQRYAQDHL